MSEATNNTTTLKEVNSDLKVAVNSIQRTLFVERLHVNIHYPADRIIPYDRDNLYPNKIKSIAQRSGTTKGAIKKLAEYSTGEGFTGMNVVVNRDGQTMWDILRHVSSEKSMFGGYALHFNYNVFGKIAEINPVNFDFVRWAKNLQQYIVSPDWGKRRRKADEITYNPFAPDNVLAEIEAAEGIEKYKGQLLYWIPNLADWYAPCNWDSVLDDAQFEAEAKLYSLSSVQNDYSLSGVLAYPKNIESSDEIKKIKEDVKGDTGSANAGGVRVIGAMPTEGMNNWKWFTPISRNNIDNLHTNQVERAKFNIYAAFNQPPILSGVASEGMFNEASFADAFNYYNSATETDRKEIERELNKIMAVSIWPSLSNIEIIPKKYVTREGKANVAGGNNTGGDKETPKNINEESQAALRGSVGGVQGILEIQQAVSAGTSDYDAAIEILKEIFGFKEDQAKKILGTPNITQPIQPQPNG